jgi:hypothetical protein
VAQQAEIKAAFDALLRRNGLSSSARLTRAQVIDLARSSASAARGSALKSSPARWGLL